MKYKCSRLLRLFVWLSLFCFSCCADGGSSTDKIRCIAKERDALLQFKRGIEYNANDLLTSWVGQECCLWDGIHCSNNSGHVISLDLDSNWLIGTVSSSLVELKQLEYLDLSINHFQGQPIPSFIGSLLHLKYLDLSYSDFGGEVPHQLANLSSLTYIGLGNEGLNVKDLRWLSHLTLLTNITLSYANLSLDTEWMQTVNNLPVLKSLHMDACSFPTQTSLSLLKYTNSSTTLDTLSLRQNYWEDTRILEWVSNFTKLSSTFSYLDLSGNDFSGPIPSSLGNFHSLVHLDLSGNRFEGPIPDTISNLKHLVHLGLSYNNFQGSKWNPEVLGSLCSLQMLYLTASNITSELSTIIQPLSQCVHKSLITLNLAHNHIWGSLPDELGTFFSLRELRLSNNSFKSTISNHHLSNLSSLTVLDLSHNPTLVFNISANWVPPFQLDLILLGSCMLGPYFPNWLLTQTNFSVLDISNSSISDTIPTSFWNSLPPNLYSLNMSGNMIHGNIPDVPISWLNIPEIDLSSNLFHGSIPYFLGNASDLYLNDNNFSDCALFFSPRTKVVLSSLDLSNNKLSGELPSSWGSFSSLSFLSLDGNDFSGSLPSTMGMLTQLMGLHLHKNNISGKLPIALRKCRHLAMLDLSHNSLAGGLPNWFGNAFDKLLYLNLRSNDFHGGLPLSLCEMSTLQILDISTNRFTGFIPKCIHNLTGMMHRLDDNIYSYNSAWIMWKRVESIWGRTKTRLVKLLDMSNNELEGPIPDGISRLVGLMLLDLSRNRLNGSITPNIGQLTSLEYLNLSRNKICGEIPSSLSTISFLGTLDVSHNNLSGRIPHGTQLQGFSASSYIGNPGLCGNPLPRCPGDPTPVNSPKENTSSHQDDDYNDDDDNDNIFPGLYISVVLGFIVGFWGVCGTLVIKRSWRHTFFKFFDDIKDKLHTLVVVNKARVLRRNP